MRSRAETILQKAAASWLRSRGWLFFHCPNESDVPPYKRGQLAAMGVDPGVPDLMIHEPVPATTTAMDAYIEIRTQFYAGIAIELKAPGKRPTKAQREWLAALKARGWLTAVCRTLDEVKAVCSVLDQ